MTAKIATYNKPEDFARVAASIKAGNTRGKGLMQEASIALIEHMAKHGDYTLVYHLADAANSFGRNLSAAWQGYITAHSWLVYNPKGLKGRALTNAKVEDLWARNAKSKKEDNLPLLEKAKAAVDGKPNYWFTYKKPAASNDEPMNVPDAIARFVKRLQNAINEGRANDGNNKPMTYDDILDMATKAIKDIKPAPIKVGVQAPEPVAATVKARKPRKARAVKGETPVTQAPAAEVKAA